MFKNRLLKLLSINLLFNYYSVDAMMQWQIEVNLSNNINQRIYYGIFDGLNNFVRKGALKANFAASELLVYEDGKGFQKVAITELESSGPVNIESFMPYFIYLPTGRDPKVEISLFPHNEVKIRPMHKAIFAEPKLVVIKPPKTMTLKNDTQGSNIYYTIMQEDVEGPLNVIQSGQEITIDLPYNDGAYAKIILSKNVGSQQKPRFEIFFGPYEPIGNVSTINLEIDKNFEVKKRNQ